MKTAQVMALIVPPVNQLKRRAMTRPDGEHTMFPTLVAVREDRVLAVVSTPRIAVTLACAHTLAVGLAPQVLVLAAQVTLPDGREAIAYTSMDREHTAGFAVQPYAVHAGEVSFATPERGRVEDRRLMDELARAMAHTPMDDTRVARKPDPRPDGPRPEGVQAMPTLIDQAEGRMALDAGTCATVQRTVAGIGGTTVFLARDGEHATRLLAHGMPDTVLLS